MTNPLWQLVVESLDGLAGARRPTATPKSKDEAMLPDLLGACDKHLAIQGFDS
jgi:hypothetical protein